MKPHEVNQFLLGILRKLPRKKKQFLVANVVQCVFACKALGPLDYALVGFAMCEAAFLHPAGYQQKAGHLCEGVAFVT